MKSPRDLLLERHRHQLPALDQLRGRVIAAEYPHANVVRSPEGLINLSVGALRRTLGQHPMAWSSLAAAWAVILALNFSARLEGESLVAAGPRATPREILLGMHEYQKQLATLLLDPATESRTAAPGRATPARPRSDAHRWRRDAAIPTAQHA